MERAIITITESGNVNIPDSNVWMSFNQAFSADGAVCSLKEDKEGRFDLRIDGVSHHSWFRRKKDEFMEALGLSTSRIQNRGMKL